MTKPRKKVPGKPGKPQTHIDIAKVEKLASQGLTQQQICDALGICVQTMITRKRTNLKLMEAMKRGQAAGIAEVTNALFNQATTGNNTAAAIFYLKNRAQWQDRVDLTVEQSLPAPLVIEVPFIDVKPEPVPTLGQMEKDHE